MTKHKSQLFVLFIVSLTRVVIRTVSH